MIIRIVTMTFHKENCIKFEEIFQSVKDSIRQSPGCHHLELLRDINNPCMYQTYSIWEDEQDLENYRHSDLFKDTWRDTKALFSEKPRAHSLHKLYVLP